MVDKDDHHHIENCHSYKALKVNPGISQPPSINPNVAERLKNRKRKKYSVDDLAGIENQRLQKQTSVEADCFIVDNQVKVES